MQKRKRSFQQFIGRRGITATLLTAAIYWTSAAAAEQCNTFEVDPVTGQPAPQTVEQIANGGEPVYFTGGSGTTLVGVQTKFGLKPAIENPDGSWDLDIPPPPQNVFYLAPGETLKTATFSLHYVDTDEEYGFVQGQTTTYKEILVSYDLPGGEGIERFKRIRSFADLSTKYAQFGLQGAREDLPLLTEFGTYVAIREESFTSYPNYDFLKVELLTDCASALAYFLNQAPPGIYSGPIPLSEYVCPAAATGFTNSVYASEPHVDVRLNTAGAGQFDVLADALARGASYCVLDWIEEFGVAPKAPLEVVFDYDINSTSTTLGCSPFSSDQGMIDGRGGNCTFNTYYQNGLENFPNGTWGFYSMMDDVDAGLCPWGYNNSPFENLHSQLAHQYLRLALPQRNTPDGLELAMQQAFGGGTAVSAESGLECEEDAYFRTENGNPVGAPLDRAWKDDDDGMICLLRDIDAFYGDGSVESVMESIQHDYISERSRFFADTLVDTLGDAHEQDIRDRNEVIDDPRPWWNHNNASPSSSHARACELHAIDMLTFEGDDVYLDQGVSWLLVDEQTKYVANNRHCRQLQPSCQAGGGFSEHQVAVRFRAPRAGTYDFDTTDHADFDTVLQIADGCQAQEIACNDDTYIDGQFSTRSRITHVTLDAGEVVTIIVGGYQDATGSAVITVTYHAP